MSLLCSESSSANVVILALAEYFEVETVPAGALVFILSDAWSCASDSARDAVGQAYCEHSSFVSVTIRLGSMSRD